MALLLPQDKEILPPCPDCADAALAAMQAKHLIRMRGMA